MTTRRTRVLLAGTLVTALTGGLTRLGAGVARAHSPTSSAVAARMGALAVLAAVAWTRARVGPGGRPSTAPAPTGQPA